jgi:predicted nuclease of predicted toxin-antitoxin system
VPARRDAAAWSLCPRREVPDRRAAAGPARGVPKPSRARRGAHDRLPDGNRSTDLQIAQLADIDGRIVVTKDQDFRDGHLLARSPRQLLVVATGNITNNALLSLFELHLDAIVSALDEADFVELSQDALALGRRREDADS